MASRHESDFARLEQLPREADWRAEQERRRAEDERQNRQEAESRAQIEGKKTTFEVVMDESGRKDDKIAKTILGTGTSSIVYLIDKNKAEKRFKSPDDLLNEQTIYQILGSHPRLVSIYHFGAEGIIMDWMEKGDLACYIKSHPEVVQRGKHQWITQIAESFSLLHKHHISHCDSKLEDFLLDDDYDIKICGFASSHNYRALSHDPAIQPPRYRRAVDDFDETVFNPADDIFAFGSICYEISTGGPPYPQLDDEGVRLRFARGYFPATEGLCFGPIIRDCWNGTYVSFEANFETFLIFIVKLTAKTSILANAKDVGWQL